MAYNPDIHNHRSIRLKGYDYSRAGAYFVTIILRHRLCLLGEVTNGEMLLNPAGEMIVDVWQEIPQRFTGWDIDAFVVMPNHIHGILVKGDVIGGSSDMLEGSTENERQDGKRLGDVVGAYKSITTNRYISGVKQNGWPGFDKYFWQPDYHERIIRDENELNIKREYIANNPSRWAEDDENPNLL